MLLRKVANSRVNNYLSQCSQGFPSVKEVKYKTTFAIKVLRLKLPESWWTDRRHQIRVTFSLSYYFPWILFLLFKSFFPFLLQPSTRKYTLRGKHHTPVILEGIYLIWARYSLWHSQPPPSMEAEQRKQKAENKISWNESREWGHG